MTKQLENKTALVTGGSRGIDREIAKRLAAGGATIAIAYNSSPEGADETVGAIKQAGGKACALHAGVSETLIPDIVMQNGEKFRKHTGATMLDVLVNNGGSSGFGGLAAATAHHAMILAMHDCAREKVANLTTLL